MRASLFTIATCTALTLPAQVGTPQEGQRAKDTSGQQDFTEQLHRIHLNDVESAVNSDLIRYRKHLADSLRAVADSLEKSPNNP